MYHVMMPLLCYVYSSSSSSYDYYYFVYTKSTVLATDRGGKSNLGYSSTLGMSVQSLPTAVRLLPSRGINLFLVWRALQCFCLCNNDTVMFFVPVQHADCAYHCYNHFKTPPCCTAPIPENNHEYSSSCPGFWSPKTNISR